MVRITNEVLAEKIDGVKEDLKDMKQDIKLNNQFRNQAKGMLTTFTFIAGIIGGGIMWLFNRIWNN